MAEPASQDTQEKQDAWTSLGVRTDIPHPARVYNYLLGGKDNFAADRDAAEMSLALLPEVRDSALGNRRFLGRAVAFLRDQGIRQFLDIGTGLPISPNTHEIAQQGHPDARVVYVDNDPVVFMRAEVLMADDKTISVIRADLRDTDTVLATAGKHLDLTRPVALMFVASLHNIPDADDPAGLVARYLAALAPGSYLVISHVTDEFAPEQMHAVTEQYAQRDAVFIGRSRDAITAMFNGRKLLDPGVVQISYWRPHEGQPEHNANRVWGFAGVAQL
jgi:SAM-dependent methyltransferase